MKIYDHNCKECELHRVTQNVCFTGKGIKTSNVMVIMDSPGYHEDKVNKALEGKPGKLLRSLLLENGIIPTLIFITHLVKCRTPDGRPIENKEVKACKVYLDKEIKMVKPKYILLLGANTSKALIGGKITEMHGRAIEKNGITYFSTFSPGLALRDPKKLPLIENDINKFSKLIRGETIVESKVELDLHVVSSVKDFMGMIEFIRESSILAIDTETKGLYRHQHDMNLFGIGNMKSQWVLPLEYWASPFRGKHRLQRKLLNIIREVSKRKLLIAQNGKFDNLMMMHHYGINFPFKKDTMLMSHLVDENSPNGLKYGVINFLNGEDYDIDKEDKQGIGVPPKKYCEYLGKDLYYTVAYYHYLKERLDQEPALVSLLNKLVMPVSRAYEKAESRGIYLHLDRMNKVGKDLEDDLAKLERGMFKYVKKEVNWGSPQQVSKILYEDLKIPVPGLTAKKAPSTSEENLKKIRHNHKVIPLLLKHRTKSKLSSGFIKGWNKRRVGNYIYPSFKIPGTVTGRPSCADPNLQQVPRESTIRSLISAPPGWVFWEADYSQIELRIAALIAQERNMLRIFDIGGDIHIETGIAVTGKSELTTEERKSAKAVNFGFIYGMGWKTFVDYAFDKYDVVLTDDQGKEFRNRYFERYPDLKPWHERQKKIVKYSGRVRTLTGRIRRLPEIYSPDQGLRAQAERNAINSPVQGTAAELTLMAFAEISRVLNPKIIKPLGTIHDANVGIVREESQLEELKKVRDIMVSPKILRELRIKLDIPILVDVKVGDWGVGKELKFN